jgi:hypothetical protein
VKAANTAESSRKKGIKGRVALAAALEQTAVAESYKIADFCGYRKIIEIARCHRSEKADTAGNNSAGWRLTIAVYNGLTKTRAA